LCNGDHSFISRVQLSSFAIMLHQQLKCTAFSGC
jgi:hypothetical protein